MAVALAAAPAFAQTHVDRIVQQLMRQGYLEIEISRTFLGRTRIEAESPTHEREIIINPRTGEILRDYWHLKDDDEAGDDDDNELLSPGGGSFFEDDEDDSGKDDGGEDDEDDEDEDEEDEEDEEDDEDDEDEEDRSGSNSGKG